MKKHKKKRRAEVIPLFGFAVAVAAFIYALTLNVPTQVAERVGTTLAAASISISAAVPANPDNTLAAQLQQKESELNAREQALRVSGEPIDRFGLYSLLASIALFFLVGMNFFLDWRRSKGKEGPLTKTLLIDLRSRR